MIRRTWSSDPPAVTLLEVGHHGSAGSSSSEFLRVLAPEVSVVQVGAGNSYGHPTEEALSRVSGAGAKIFRTDLQGEVTVVTDGVSYRTKTERVADADAGNISILFFSVRGTIRSLYLGFRQARSICVAPRHRREASA